MIEQYIIEKLYKQGIFERNTEIILPNVLNKNEIDKLINEDKKNIINYALDYILTYDNEQPYNEIKSIFNKHSTIDKDALKYVAFHEMHDYE